MELIRLEIASICSFKERSNLKTNKRIEPGKWSQNK